jgi:hypothetical protein
MRGNGARIVRSRRGHCAQLARAPTRWGLAGGKVLPASTGGVPGWRRAGGVQAWLTLAVARRAGAERGVGVGTVAGVRGEMGSGERRGSGREAGKGDAGAVSERRGESRHGGEKFRPAVAAVAPF